MKKWIGEAALREREEASFEELEGAMDRAVKQTEDNLRLYHGAFPEANSVGGFYPTGKNTDWTSGFWTGELWISYDYEKDPEKKSFLLSEGEKAVLSFSRRMEERHYIDHHDMGFLFLPSCVYAWRLTGNRTARETALLAAEQLKSRYRAEGRYIQAWGEMRSEGNARLIIDCLLNLPLLYWASEESGRSEYREIAEMHTETTMRHILREDGSSWHTLFFDPKSGEFSHGATCQGYQDGSAWARGQSWGIYGTAIAYRNTKNADYLRDFRRISAYFLSHLPEDLCPYWDLSFGDGDQEEPRDSSSLAIAACGFLEMSKYLPREEAEYYSSLSKKLLKSLIDHYQVKDRRQSDGQLLHGTYAKKTPFNTCKNSGVDECVIWGDYFFMEALNRMLRPESMSYF